MIYSFKWTIAYHHSTVLHYSTFPPTYVSWYWYFHFLNFFLYNAKRGKIFNNLSMRITRERRYTFNKVTSLTVPSLLINTTFPSGYHPACQQFPFSKEDMQINIVIILSFLPELFLSSNQKGVEYIVC